MSAVWGQYGTAGKHASPESKEIVVAAKSNKDKRCGLRGWISDGDFGENFKITCHEIVGRDAFRKKEAWISWGRLVHLEGEPEALLKVKYDEVKMQRIPGRADPKDKNSYKYKYVEEDRERVLAKSKGTTTRTSRALDNVEAKRLIDRFDEDDSSPPLWFVPPSFSPHSAW